MKAQDDFTLKRDTVLGFLIFLQSELNRHKDDIAFINKTILEVVKKEGVGGEEWDLIVEMANRYRKF